MELTIDTSTNLASIAISQRGTLLADVCWHTEHNHTVELMPRLIELLERNRAYIQDITALVVAKGPGSFNGLRVGLATVKGMAFALDIPLVSIGTLEAIAYPHADSELPVCPILQAGRGEVATAIFRKMNSDWIKTVDEYITTIDDLCPTIKEPTIFCGEISSEQLTRLREALGKNANLPDETAISSRASYLANLGWCKIEAGEFDDASTLQPLYLRKPSITKPKRRKHDALSNMRSRGK